MSGDKTSDSEISDVVFIRENLACSSKIELPYYSVDAYKDVCIHCGLLLIGEGTEENYPKCNRCSSEPDVKRTMERTITSTDLKSAKKQKKK